MKDKIIAIENLIGALCSTFMMGIVVCYIVMSIV